MQSDDTQHEPEVLVILRPGAGTDGLARLRSEYPVTSVMPPRIAVLSAGAGIERVSGLPDVEAVLAQPEDEAPPSLSEPERLFVSAWRARQHAGPKTRAGDGLSWDAPGFLPPDPPIRK
jgi:hypothetical protein